MNNKFSKNRLISLVVVMVGSAFVFGWYFGGHQVVQMNNTYASLAGIEDCSESSCGTDSFLSLFNIFNANKTRPQNVDFYPFWKTWQILNENYVDTSSSTDKKATDQDRVWGAISGMVETLGDPYTVFMPPQEKTKFEEGIRGNFSGVGMEVGYKDGIPTVISPLPNTPAKKAGILAGDKILEIDGVSTINLSLDDAINKIRGEAGTTVVLTILRDKEKESQDVKIVRAVITIPTIDTKIVTGKDVNDKIFVISLYNFSAQSSDLFKKAIEEFTKTGSKKLILDLRGNPGGYLDAAVDMASWFLPQGKTVVRETSGVNKPEKMYRSSGYNIFKNSNLEMVILIDKGSASASEILAGALSEYGVAKLVGEKTFGKGSVQELISITDDSSLKVTIARWLTPNGKSISHNGLEPDFLVMLPEITATSTLSNFKDTQFDKAVELLK